MSRAFHHLALGAKDVEGVAAFYRDLLGLEEVDRHHHRDGRLRSIWLALGEGVLMIEETEERLRRVTAVGAGPFLVAVAVTAGEREALESRLAAAGHAVEERTRHTSYLRDPEGNRVALSDYPLPHPPRGAEPA